MYLKYIPEYCTSWEWKNIVFKIHEQTEPASNDAFHSDLRTLEEQPDADLLRLLWLLHWG